MQEITIGKTYKHYKGNLYKIINFAKHSETTEEMIVYQSIKNGDIWVRPKNISKFLNPTSPSMQRTLLPEDAKMVAILI